MGARSFLVPVVGVCIAIAVCVVVFKSCRTGEDGAETANTGKESGSQAAENGPALPEPQAAALGALWIEVRNDLNEAIPGARVSSSVGGVDAPAMKIGDCRFSIDVTKLSPGKTVTIKGTAPGHKPNAIQAAVPSAGKSAPLAVLNLMRFGGIVLTITTPWGKAANVEVVVVPVLRTIQETLTYPEVLVDETAAIFAREVSSDRVVVGELEPARSYAIRIQSHGCVPAVVAVSELGAGEMREVEVCLSASSVLEVLVLNPQARPIGNCVTKAFKYVQTSNEEHWKRTEGESRTNDQGIAVLPGLSAGRTLLYVERSENTSASIATAELDFADGVTQRVTVILQDFPRIVIRVEDAEQTPLVGTRVGVSESRLGGADVRLVTNEMGTATFVGFRPGTLVVVIHDRNDVQVATEEIELPEGQALLEKTFVVKSDSYAKKSPIFIWGTKDVLEGEPLKIYAFDHDTGNLVTARRVGGTRVDWPVEVSTLRHGKYRIELGMGDVWGYVDTFDVGPVNNEVLVDTWFGSRSIDGRVLDEDGDPVTGARVERLLAASATEGCHSVVTDERGYFRLPFPDVPESVYFRADVGGEQKSVVLAEGDLRQSGVLTIARSTVRK